jgi:hypothetical protein
VSRKKESFGEKLSRRLKQPLSKQKVVGFVRTKLGLVKPHELPTPTPQGPECEYPEPYHEWIAARVRLRAPEYPAKADPKLFSIITPVFDTPPKFLKEMAASVFAQDFPFQWVVCDNGSKNAETRKVLKQIAKDPRVILVRLEENAGIMGGTRAAFDVASGRYVLPVDSDDTLYPDALRVMASCLERTGWPALAYSDEDKMHETSVPCWPFFKPAWDPALFLNCCYVAHLCAIDLEAAKKSDAYTDNDARGCHDWDTFTRLITAGHTPVHVPEVLYSWRIHAGSSSSFADRAKMYTIDCQQHVLGNFLKRTTKPGLFELRTNPLFGHVGMWYAARNHVEPRPVHAFVFSEGSPAQLQRCLKSLLGDAPYPKLNVTVLGALTPEHATIVKSFLNLGSAGRPDRSVGATDCPDGYAAFLRGVLKNISDNALIATISDGLQFANLDWAWEASGIFDLHADAAACCGRVASADGATIASAGEYLGVGGLAGSPDEGRAVSDSGYSGFVFCSRTVSALPWDFHVCNAALLKTVLADVPENASRFMLGKWIAAEAARAGKRVVYSPHLFLKRSPEWYDAPQPGDAEIFEFLKRHAELFAHERYYPRFFKLGRGQGYQLAMPWQRAEVINGLLSRLHGPIDFVKTIEMNPQNYCRARFSARV